jgi:hypothetical protein
MVRQLQYVAHMLLKPIINSVWSWTTQTQVHNRTCNAITQPSPTYTVSFSDFPGAASVVVNPLQPAMDMYSLGVLLFIMLVGRKPWDAQRSHTLAYAVQPTCEAPALGDPVYLGLSAPAKQLLLLLLDEDPSRRPSAQQVLGHTWVLQGGVCKVRVALHLPLAGTLGVRAAAYHTVPAELGCIHLCSLLVSIASSAVCPLPAHHPTLLVVPLCLCVWGASVSCISPALLRHTP